MRAQLNAYSADNKRNHLLRKLRKLVEIDQPRASFDVTWAWTVQFANREGAGRDSFGGIAELRPYHVETAIHMYEAGVR